MQVASTTLIRLRDWEVGWLTGPLVGKESQLVSLTAPGAATDLSAADIDDAGRISEEGIHRRDRPSAPLAFAVGRWLGRVCGTVRVARGTIRDRQQLGGAGQRQAGI
jgi:hypothetical protein